MLTRVIGVYTHLGKLKLPELSFFYENHFPFATGFLKNYTNIVTNSSSYQHSYPMPIPCFSSEKSCTPVSSSTTTVSDISGDSSSNLFGLNALPLSHMPSTVVPPAALSCTDSSVVLVVPNF